MVLEYYLLRNKNTGEFFGGTGYNPVSYYTTKKKIPKLYKLGSAKSVKTQKEKYANTILEILPVTLIIGEPI